MGGQGQTQKTINCPAHTQPVPKASTTFYSPAPLTQQPTKATPTCVPMNSIPAFTSLSIIFSPHMLLHRDHSWVPLLHSVTWGVEPGLHIWKHLRSGKRQNISFWLDAHHQNQLNQPNFKIHELTPSNLPSFIGHRPTNASGKDFLSQGKEAMAFLSVPPSPRSGCGYR